MLYSICSHMMLIFDLLSCHGSSSAADGDYLAYSFSRQIVNFRLCSMFVSMLCFALRAWLFSWSWSWCTYILYGTSTLLSVQTKNAMRCAIQCGSALTVSSASHGPWWSWGVMSIYQGALTSRFHRFIISSFFLPFALCLCLSIVSLSCLPPNHHLMMTVKNDCCILISSSRLCVSDQCVNHNPCWNHRFIHSRVQRSPVL